MIDHISIGVRDVARSRDFYDAILTPLGYRRLSTGDTSLGYGGDSVVLWIGHSDRPVPADTESGLHFCFTAPTRRSVHAFHDAGLAAGGIDNGPAGPRADYGEDYYAAFIIDPDGYRLEAYCSLKE